MAPNMVDCEVLISDEWPRCAISTMSKDGYSNSTRTASSYKYNSDKSRLAVPVQPCVQRQFQVFLSDLQSAVCSDLVVLHRYRCHVTTDLLGRPANGEKTATTGNANGSTAQQQDQLVHQRTTIDADNAARASVIPIAREVRGSLVDLRDGNKLEMFANEAHEWKAMHQAYRQRSVADGDEPHQ